MLKLTFTSVNMYMYNVPADNWQNGLTLSYLK